MINLHESMEPGTAFPEPKHKEVEKMKADPDEIQYFILAFTVCQSTGLHASRMKSVKD